jgi:hypothetical protein
MEIEQDGGLTPENAHRLGRELAVSFGVQEDEVGILRKEKGSLVFCHPARLQEVGRIPLNTSASVAARTANTRRGEVLNNFTQVKHTTFFEAVELRDPESEGEQNADRELRTIQKLMAAPISDGKRVYGVIQISRKGPTPAAAGADFTSEDLQRLAATAASLVRCFE